MKFIRDIIGEKREKVGQPGGDPADGQPGGDLMAAILSEARAEAEPLRLDDSCLVQDGGSPGTVGETAAEPDIGWDGAAQVSDADDGAGEDGEAEQAALDALDAPDLEFSHDEAGCESGFELDFDRLSALANAEDTADDAPAVDEAPVGGGSDPQADAAVTAVLAAFDAIDPSQGAGEDDFPYKTFKRRRAAARAEDLADATPDEPPVADQQELLAAPEPAAAAASASLDEDPFGSLSGHEAPMDEPFAGAAAEDAGALDSGPGAAVDVPAPAMGRASSRAGRVKTRLLGFDAGQEGSDPFARRAVPSHPDYSEFPVAWLVVAGGPGRGAAFTLFSGVTVIGRGEGQTVRLDFGDNSISRDNHAAIAYDPEQKAFFIGHGGKANLVRLNGRPVLSTEELGPGDIIRIGETTLRFVPLCGADFDWEEAPGGAAGHERAG